MGQMNRTRSFSAPPRSHGWHPAFMRMTDPLSTSGWGANFGSAATIHRVAMVLRRCTSSHVTIPVFKSAGICPPANAGP